MFKVHAQPTYRMKAGFSFSSPCATSPSQAALAKSAEVQPGSAFDMEEGASSGLLPSALFDLIESLHPQFILAVDLLRVQTHTQPNPAGAKFVTPGPSSRVMALGFGIPEESL